MVEVKPSECLKFDSINNVPTRSPSHCIRLLTVKTVGKGLMPKYFTNVVTTVLLYLYDYGLNLCHSKKKSHFGWLHFIEKAGVVISLSVECWVTPIMIIVVDTEFVLWPNFPVTRHNQTWRIWVSNSQYQPYVEYLSAHCGGKLLSLNPSLCHHKMKWWWINWRKYL